MDDERTPETVYRNRLAEGGIEDSLTVFPQDIAALFTTDRRALIDLLDDHGPLSIDDCVARTGRPPEAVRTDIHELFAYGALDRTDEGFVVAHETVLAHPVRLDGEWVGRVTDRIDAER